MEAKDVFYVAYLIFGLVMLYIIVPMGKRVTKVEVRQDKIEQRQDAADTRVAVTENNVDNINKNLEEIKGYVKTLLENHLK